MAFSLDDLNNSNGEARLGRPNGSPKRTPFVGSKNEINSKGDTPKVEISVSTARGGVNSKDSSSVKEVSPYDIAPPAPQKALNEDALKNIFGPLDAAVEREKERISKLQSDLIQEGIKELEEQEAEAALAGDGEETPADNDTEQTEGTEPVYMDNREKVFHVSDEEVEATHVDAGSDTGLTVDNDGPSIYVDDDTTHETHEDIAKKEEVEDTVEVETEDKEEDNVVSFSKSFDDDIEEALINASNEDDDDEESSNDEDETASQEEIDEIRDAVKSKIVPIKNKLNLAQFKISKTPKSVNEVLKTFTNDIKTANWVLPNAGTCEVFTPLSAVDIINLDPSNHQKSRLNTFRAIYRVIYDHIATPGKPDFEKWLRTTLFHDMDHLYFGLYLATFGDSAFINPICEKKSRENPNAKGCGHQFIEDHKPMDYVKFANDESKEKFEKIRNKETMKNDSYDVTLVQVSDEYAFGLRMPSIYNVILETASLSQDFLQKYNQLLEVFSYIDDIYYIDVATSTLSPIKYDIDKKNQPKTTLNKIRAYNEIYRTLSADQQTELLKHIRSMENKMDIGLTYVVPASTCPECGNTIPERTISPQYLLFMRHQLGRLASM